MYNGVFYQDTGLLLVKELGATVQSIKEDYWLSEMVSVRFITTLPSSIRAAGLLLGTGYGQVASALSVMRLMKHSPEPCVLLAE